MDPIDIRSATTDDATALAELSTQLGYPTSTLQSEDRLRTILNSDEQVVLVACLTDGSVVGWVHVFLAHRIESDSFAELGGFVVAEQHRRQGIGRYLLMAAEEWVNSCDVERLRVRSRTSRVDAHAFYEKYGFSRTKEQHVFEKPISTSGY